MSSRNLSNVEMELMLSRSLFGPESSALPFWNWQDLLYILYYMIDEQKKILTNFFWTFVKYSILPITRSVLKLQPIALQFWNPQSMLYKVYGPNSFRKNFEQCFIAIILFH